MNDIPTGLLFGCIFILIIISAFFSGSETSMLSLNRYRLRHLSKNNHKAAKRSAALLQRPERLIGMILIGNNLVNILASAIATVIALRLFGDAGIAIATVTLTIVILIFAEITPKTIAAFYPEKFAFPASIPLKALLTLLSPLVWMMNNITHFMLRLIGLNPDKQPDDQISSAELRTIVDEAGELIPDRHQAMLLNILDLEDATIEDIMIPKAEVFAININDSEDDILQALQSCAYTRLPVYEDDIDNIIGILHMRSLSKLLTSGAFTKAAFKAILREPVFAPEGTSLHMQLMNFQKQKRRLAIVVDEYGDIMGLVTLEDILEEIVGEFTSNLTEDSDDFEALDDGSYIILGSATLRDISKHTGWDLPTETAKTLNGLILEQLESLPKVSTTFDFNSYTIEILAIDGNMVGKARIYPH